MSEPLSIAHRRGRVSIKRRGRVLLDAESPGAGDWLWSFESATWAPLQLPLRARPKGLALRITKEGRIRLLCDPCPSCFSAAASLPECEAWVQGLTASQMRRLLAWLVYQQREELPANVREVIAGE